MKYNLDDGRCVKIIIGMELLGDFSFITPTYSHIKYNN